MVCGLLGWGWPKRCVWANGVGNGMCELTGCGWVWDGARCGHAEPNLLHVQACGQHGSRLTFVRPGHGQGCVCWDVHVTRVFMELSTLGQYLHTVQVQCVADEMLAKAIVSGRAQ